MPKMTIWVYTLINPETKEQAFTSCNECSDTICIGVRGLDGTYQQYDSYEAYHIHDWAAARGLVSMCAEMEISIPESILPNQPQYAQECAIRAVTASESKVYRVLAGDKECFLMAPSNKEAAKNARFLLNCKHFDIDYCRIDTKDNMLAWIKKGGINGKYLLETTNANH